MSEASILFLAPCVARRVVDQVLWLDSSDLTVSISGARTELLPCFEQLEQGVLDSACLLPDALLTPLLEHGMVCALPARADSAAGFMAPFFDMCDRWVEDIFSSPFWAPFLAGRSSRRQVFAFLGQLYHRTAGADVHNRIAAETCPDAAIAPLLWRHYEEELGHANMIAAGLRRCGSGGNRCVESAPLAGTRALIDFMIGASAEPAAYLGCYGIFHAPSTIRTAGELVDQFARFARLYPFAAEGFEAVGRHAALDYQLDHDHIALESWIRSEGVPDVAAIAAAGRGARGAASAFRLIFDELALMA